MPEENDRDSKRIKREASARKRAREAFDRSQIEAVLSAAGIKEAKPEAIEAISALMEERIAQIAARSAEAAEDREERQLSAAAVAVAAQREAESRRSAAEIR